MITFVHSTSLSTMIPTKRLLITFFACLLIFIVYGSAAAQTLWVKPSSEITMRRGKGTDFKIISVIRDGTPISLISEEDDWAKIRLESGREGWVLRRYLSDTPPLKEQVERLNIEKQELVLTNQTLKERYENLTAEKEQVEERLTSQRAHIEEQFKACVADRDSISNEYTTLQADTADVIQTKKDLKAARAKTESLEKELSRYKQENERLTKNETLKWFLAGGGVLLLGWLIGLISRRSRKKRPSLL